MRKSNKNLLKRKVNRRQRQTFTHARTRRAVSQHLGKMLSEFSGVMKGEGPFIQRQRYWFLYRSAYRVGFSRGWGRQGGHLFRVRMIIELSDIQFLDQEFRYLMIIVFRDVDSAKNSRHPVCHSLISELQLTPCLSSDRHLVSFKTLMMCIGLAQTNHLWS